MTSDRRLSAFRLLVVDDDEAVLRLVCTLLQRDGHTVLSAHEGSEALRLLQARGREIDVLVTDVRMPGLGGNELVQAARALHPRIGVIVMTGFAEEELPPDAEALRKPFRPDMLLHAVGRVTARTTDPDRT
jgi:CheY-like chemotaxis protein